MVRVLFWPLGSESRIEWRQIGCGVFRVSAAAGGGSGGGYSGGFGDGSSGKGDGSSGGDGEKKWSLISWYLALLKKHPVLTKSVTSAFLNLVGDLACQLVTTPGVSGAFLRLVIDQLIFTPAFVGLFLSALLTLEGRPSLVLPKLQQEWFPTVIANWKLWIPFQFLNFLFVQQQFQVLAANSLALIWNFDAESQSFRLVVGSALSSQGLAHKSDR
ncbi:hypothetical protein ACET3Z_020749 [Daucus carota]